MKSLLIGVIAAVLACAGMAQAQDARPLSAEEQAELTRLKTLLDGLTPVRGVVTVGPAKATLNLGQNYYFLNAADARKVLVDGWHNPPDSAEGVLGIVFPEGKTFLDESWAAVITYEATNYVSDASPKPGEYDELMESMRAGETERNEARTKAGYPPTHLMGWAQPPSYDAATHNLIWARDIQFGNETDHALNYDMRHLGRRGVLSMNLVASMSQLAEVRTAAETLAKTAEFDAGSRYADFQEGDKLAGYGLVGLVAAGTGLAVAKKAGLIALIILFAKKGAVFFIAGGAAVAAWFRRRLQRNKAAVAELEIADPPLDEAPVDQPPVDEPLGRAD